MTTVVSAGPARAVPAAPAGRSFRRVRVLASVSILLSIPLTTPLAMLLTMLLTMLPLVPAGTAFAAARRQAIGVEVVAVLDDQHGVEVEVLPAPGEGLLSLTERVCGDRDRHPQVVERNGGQRALRSDRRYRVPYACLSAELQFRALRALFPEDGPAGAAYRHRVLGPSETLWRIALWFTGDGARFAALRDANALADEAPALGASVLIPRALLRPEFAALVTPAAAPGQLPLPTSAAAGEPGGGDGEPALGFGSDDAGEYASYRLRRGEALYSSVVMRFTGLLFAEDVNRLAEEIASRSGIADVTDIPVGFAVKIPLDVLSPEFLPAGHPRRAEWDREQSAVAQHENTVTRTDLRGVTVILDAGHGGRDVGASLGGVWESLYVYDIMVRTKRLLEATTAARAITTTRSGKDYELEDRDVLSFSRGHAVLTDPPYTIEEAQVSTNLRWYFANSHYRAATRRGHDEVVFLSIHADSLHPLVRGAMVYVPGLLPLPASYGMTGAVYSARQEVKQEPRVSMSKQDRVRSEGLSRDLAQRLLAELRREGVAIHPNKPIRDRIVRRRGRPWVPAVLRYNHVPTKVLLEVCNLANERDRALIRTRDFRQTVAEAIVAGLLSYYGEGMRPGPEVASQRE